MTSRTVLLTRTSLGAASALTRALMDSEHVEDVFAEIQRALEQVPAA